MRLLRFFSIVLLFSLFLASAFSEEKEMTVIPPKVGSWDEMWKELPKLEAIYMPIKNIDFFSGKKDGTPVNVKDIKISSPIMEVPGPRGKTFLGQAVYTDRRMFKPGKAYMEVKPIDMFKWVLQDPEVQLMIFNARSSYSDGAKVNYVIEKIYISRLVGYMNGGAAPKGKNHELAEKP